MALVIRRVITPEQKEARLINLIKFFAMNGGGGNRARVLAKLQALGYTLQEIQAAVASITASGEIEVVDDGT